MSTSGCSPRSSTGQFLTSCWPTGSFGMPWRLAGPRPCGRLAAEPDVDGALVERDLALDVLLAALDEVGSFTIVSHCDSVILCSRRISRAPVIRVRLPTCGNASMSCRAGVNPADAGSPALRRVDLSRYMRRSASASSAS